MTLTVGAPLGAMPRLAPNGAFPGLAALAAAALARTLPVAEVEAEIGRQIDRFCDEFGAPPPMSTGTSTSTSCRA